MKLFIALMEGIFLSCGFGLLYLSICWRKLPKGILEWLVWIGCIVIIVSWII